MYPERLARMREKFVFYQLSSTISGSEPLIDSWPNPSLNGFLGIQSKLDPPVDKLV
jgi:hypothetical protein